MAAWQWLGPGNIGGRIRGIVIDPGDPSRMWAASVGGGVWHTSDGGASWATADDFLGNLACACIAMHPADPLTIYAGTGEGFGNIDAIQGNGIFMTTDGVRWTMLPATRVPDFAFVNRIAVSASGVVLAATNSGLFRSDDAARANWTRVLAGCIADVKFDPRQGPQKWTTIFGGDGGWCAADPTDPDVSYGEYVFLAIHRNTDGGASSDHSDYIDGQVWNEATGGWDWKPAPYRIPDAMPVPSGQDRKALFIAPFVLDPSQPERILAGGLSLWRTNDAKTPNTPVSGPSWQPIKNPIVTSGSTRGFEISALAIAAGDPDTVWVGYANGALFLTGNGTAGSPAWQPVASASFPPQRYCTRITIDAARTDVVYAAFAGYARGNLWVTRDGGGTWSDLSATLPTAPVHAVTVHPRHAGFLYAGTEVGLFASEDSGTTWSPTNQGPTNCPVDDLFWMGETLVSVTHGRGMYRIDLSGV